MDGDRGLKSFLNRALRASVCAQRAACRPLADYSGRMPSVALPLFLVFHAAPGQRDASGAAHHAAGRLRAAGRQVGLCPACRTDDLGAAIGRAVNAAREARGVVVAVGDDSAHNAVAQAVWNAHLVMGVLPQGVRHFFGSAHGMPTDLDPAVDALLAAHPEPVPVGRVGERLFLVGASVGLYPHWIGERSRGTALLADLARLLRGKSVMTLELQAQGETRVVRTRTLFVCSNTLHLKAMGLREPLAVEAGRLAAIAVAPSPPLATLWQALRGSIGRLDGAERADRFAFDHLAVQPRRGQARMEIAIDGDIQSLPAPLVFQPAPRPLMLLVPPAGRGAGAAP